MVSITTISRRCKAHPSLFPASLSCCGHLEVSPHYLQGPTILPNQPCATRLHPEQLNKLCIAMHQQVLPYATMHHQVLSCATMHHQVLSCATMHHQVLPCAALHHQVLPCATIYYHAPPSTVLCLLNQIMALRP